MTHFLFVNLLLAAVLWTTDASTSPVIHSLNSTVTAVRGSDVTLVCQGTNVQRLDSFFKWKFNNETVENKENRNTKVTWLQGKQAKSSLAILNVSEKDVGDYRCIAHVSNFLKTDKAEASIKLRLYESIMCSKAMDVWTFWLFKGKMIEATPFHTGNEHDLSNTVTNISTFVLKNAMLSQTGVYTCGANSTGVMKTQNITVTVKDLEGPTLVQTKSNIDAVDGQNITLSCNAYKKKHFPWLEQSEQSIKRVKIGLTIYNVGLNDSGEYTCALNTSLGLHLKNVSFKVTRKPRSQPDFHIQPPTKMPETPGESRFAWNYTVHWSGSLCWIGDDHNSFYEAMEMAKTQASKIKSGRRRLRV
ncbi:unnamed protein product [Porites lobata]|uniref:Ig-like domain-containing protein n=1 Tax=Porites lobata TaxID=104759 RepID=A0ABN8R0W2_9CNID|nr:unnamed protein product [Porites lobata]